MLLTKVNLKRRKVLQDSICDICKLKEETIAHVLWNCEIARETWACTKASTPVGVSDGWTFQDILWHMIILDQVEEARVAMVVTVAWVLWCNRNVTRTGGKKKSGREMAHWAATYLAKYTTATELPGPPTPTEVLRSLWEPPPGNWYKVNVDGALLTEHKSAGVSVIIRDSEGWVEAALSKRLEVPLGALEAEAKAFETGLLFAKDIGVHEIILEGDSMIMYRALSGLSNPPLSGNHS